jgi:hypothetical protein
VDSNEISQKLGIKAETIDLYQLAGAESQLVEDLSNPADFAIAHGTALSHWQKGHKVNFRDDFSPFEGKKIRMQRALRFAAASVTILLIALGVYFHTQLFTANVDAAAVHNKFAKNYSDVTLTKLRDGVGLKKAVRDLGNLQRKLEREKKGLGPADESVASKLTLVLAAFNKCAKQTNLNIKTINITSNNITITGDTSNASTVQLLFKTLKDGGLDKWKENIDPKGGRAQFNITVRPAKSNRGN